MKLQEKVKRNNNTMKNYMVVDGDICIDNNGDMHKDIERKHTQNINSFMQIQFSRYFQLYFVKMQTLY